MIPFPTPDMTPVRHCQSLCCDLKGPETGCCIPPDTRTYFILPLTDLSEVQSVEEDWEEVKVLILEADSKMY